MGFGKITKKEKRRAQEQLTAVLVEGPQNAHYLTKPKKGQEPVVFLGNNRTLIQTLVPASAAPRFAQHQHVSALSDAQLAGDALAPPSSDYNEDFDTTPLSPRKQHASPTKGKRHKNTQGRSIGVVAAGCYPCPHPRLRPTLVSNQAAARRRYAVRSDAEERPLRMRQLGRLPNEYCSVYQ
ncbi:hypothetical protein B0H11DRAFT_2259785 [Mycena galericulata]|nr:hypothetical protein B0H11DRAFT_2259785 [Mycena galericulata]